MIKLIEKKDNAIAVSIQLLKALNVKVTSSTVEETLKEHPDYPSLLSISDSLLHWKINNLSLQLDSEKLEEIPVPFIAHLKTNGGSFVAVKKVAAGEVIYFDGEKNNNPKAKNREDFLKEWSGVILVAETTDESGEKEFTNNRKKEKLRQSKIPFIVGSCLLLIACYIPYGLKTSDLSDLLMSLLLVINFIGCIVTGLLLWYEIDQSNTVLQQICSAGKNTNCNAILQSKEAKLFGWLTWSEIGFFYFAGSFLGLLITAGYPSSTINFLAYLNLVALPYTIFSIYYQWRIAKQWCPLCVAVQALLILEFTIFYSLFWNQHILHSPLFTFSIFLSFLLPIFFWAFTKTFLQQAKNAEKYKTELNRLKHNTQIFQALLLKQKTIEESPLGLGITLGNPNAANTIIKVCNPYCGPCAGAHPVIEELIQENENVKVQIIFTSAADENDKRSKPIKHLMAIHEKNDPDLIHHALDDWYLADKKDYESFASKYPMNGELQMQTSKLTAMENWCKACEISFTPTFFVNGNRLPEMYKLNDLKYLLK